MPGSPETISDKVELVRGGRRVGTEFRGAEMRVVHTFENRFGTDA